MASSASAVVIQIDAGRNSGITTDTGWNNLNNGTDSTGAIPNDFTVADLVDSTGAPTSIDLNVLGGAGAWAGTGAHFTGTPPVPFDTAPQTAWQDSMFVRNPAAATIFFSDLNPSNTYDMLIWGARGNNGTVVDAGVTFDVTDLNGTQQGSYADSLNNLTVVSFTGLVPDANGELTILYTTEANELNEREAGAINIIQLTENAGNPLVPGDADGDGDVDDTDLGIAISNFTGPGGSGKTIADGDTDGDGDVDDTDLGVAISGFTGPLSPAAVPEPASVAMLSLGGLLIARRRRG